MDNIPILGFLFLMICTACKHEAKQIINDAKVKKAAYDQLIIKTEQAKIIIRNTNDTVVYSAYASKDTSVMEAGKMVYQMKIYQKEQRDILTKWQRDSAYQWIMKLIVNPINPANSCDDLVGSVKLTIMAGQVQQECTYYALCSWDSLSPEAKKLSYLIKSKFKNF